MLRSRYFQSVSFAVVYALVIVLSGCSGDKSTPPGTDGDGLTGILVAASGCGGFQLSADTDTISADQSCMEYSYDADSILRITHRNAGFNCCSELSAEITVEDGIITILEIESLVNGGCHCLCLYDLEFEIAGLTPGDYEINVIEPYWQRDAEKLEFSVALASQPSGTYCAYRDVYPWGMLGSPGGGIVGASRCKLIEMESDVDTIPRNMSCLEYEVVNDTLLHLIHVNTMFNCCSRVSSFITFEGTTITIEYVESFPDGACFCNCLYDLEFDIVRLVPGTYSIVMVEPYKPGNDEELVCTVDIINQPAGICCVERSW